MKMNYLNTLQRWKAVLSLNLLLLITRLKRRIWQTLNWVLSEILSMLND